MALAFQAVCKQPDGQFGVFPAPADKILIKAVDGEEIVAEKAHVAAFYAAQTSGDGCGKMC